MPTTMDLAIPDSRDVALKLPSDVLYQLEQAGSLATEILDERVTQWAEEGVSKKWIADEIGCTTDALRHRLNRLGIVIESRRGPQPKTREPRVSTIEDEYVEVEPEDIIIEPTPQYLPDLTAPDADENTRTQVARWFELGRHVQSLLDSGSDLNAKSRTDLQSIQSDADLMCLIAKRIREEVK